MKTRTPMYAILTILLLLNIADIWSTYHVLANVEGTIEGNPIARWLIEQSLLVPAKLIALAATGFWSTRTKDIRQFTIMLLAITAFYGWVVYNNLSIALRF